MEWTVYALVDPRDCKLFYIGASNNVAVRAATHSSSPDSAAYQAIQALKQLGLKPKVVSLKSFPSHWDAIIEEDTLTRVCWPLLTNRIAYGPPNPDKDCRWMLRQIVHRR